MGSEDGRGDVHKRRALDLLENVIREKVLKQQEGTEVVLKVLERLQLHGTTDLARLEKEVAAEAAAAAPPLAAAAGASAVESKQDRIEKARMERQQGKFTESWDLCYAFAKHGCCKDKNCKWRHEAYPVKEKTTAKEKAKAAASPSDTSSTTKAAVKTKGKKK